MEIWILFCFVAARALLEPENGKFKLAISVTNTLERTGRTPWKPFDSLLNINKKIGVNWSAFHMVQELPQTTPMDFEMLDQSRTDAELYLSVLPTTGWSSVADSDLEDLAIQCASLNSRGRRVFLRFAPGFPELSLEFNVPWHIWGMSPIAFKSNWSKLSDYLRKQGANQTALVWAPFEGNNYPFGQFQYSPRNGSAEFRILDTNENGKLDKFDEPYAPYYPSDDTVDWVGL
jgi:hypothetical protein